MRTDVSFDSKGVTCLGWLYLPDDLEANEKIPTIVMAHGFSGVKEQVLPEIADRIVDAGFAVLVFDYRYFGGSDGEPRCQLFPLEMVEDYRNAITWVCSQPNVDPSRIGVWGTSYSGGLVAYLGTFDRRVKAVVAQVPSLTNADARRGIDPGKWESVGEYLSQDRIARYLIGEVNYIKVVASEGEPCVLPGVESYDAFMEIKDTAPNWRNEITVESLEKIREFDPVSFIHLMAPTALMVIACENDTLIPLDAVKNAYENANEPKQFTIFPIRHFEIYRDPWRAKATDNAIEWYKKYLV